ncbi:MAG: T9SS C-terminal target domain-containing protein [Bacteroidetes bacterium]|nr:T9SS C-terminal target domain-containing protein [Bacteroidota bacterium]
MKNIYRVSVIALGFLLVSNALIAREQPVLHPKSGPPVKEAAAGCTPGSAYKFLDINNVRTLIYSYGNGWFLENAQYEVPKGSKKMSMFSFSLWIGGIDMNNNLKLAAYKYGQGPTITTAHTNNDFWPGPLTIDGTASITDAVCAKYDQLYPMTRTDVTTFLAWFEDPGSYPEYSIPKNIQNWPGNGDPSKGQSLYLAPFFDQNGDGVYTPSQGDYPYYDLSNDLCPNKLKIGERQKRAHIRNGETSDTAGILVDQVIKGDQTLWSVYNDKGNYHSETNGAPIGMEIRAQYFAFATNDEINNMTFYSYEIINRSTYTLSGTYFSQWVDPDLGYAGDDYVGCDVMRGLGYCYNGKPIDGTGQVEAYGAHPPAVGVDFFQGPYLDADGYDNPSFNGPGIKGPSFKNMPNKCDMVTYNNQLIDMTWGAHGEYSGSVLVKSEAINGINFGDGIVDNERYGMRRFVYHNNTGVPAYMQDPAYAPQYYNYLKGIWLDNTKMVYGGNGNLLNGGGYGPICDFMFPGDSDPCLWGTNGLEPNRPGTWTEATAGNNPSDRRFMQSAGEFTLLPGACNYITVGIPWARSIAGTNLESVELLRQVDDKCQTLFDNCFAVLNGPNAPDLTIEELNQSLILYLTNRKTNDAGSNYQERYQEYDPTIQTPQGSSKRYDSLYHFEGYQIFQLKDATVSAADLDDNTKARQVAQCDIKNGVTSLVDWAYDPNLGGNSGQVMVVGADAGVKHSFVLGTDLFSQGDPTFINHKQYYYMVIAYAYNNYKQYNPNDPAGLDGQKKPYLRGRNNLKQYTAIPHIPVGTVINAAYGVGPVITRVQGQGNGGMILDLSQGTIDTIMMKPPADSVNNVYGSPDYPIAYKATYQVGYGPLAVKVIDPLNVANGKYMVKLDSMVSGPAGNPFYNKSIKFGHWTAVDLTNYKSYRSDTTTIYPYESLFIDLGFALTINQVPLPGDSINSSGVASNNGLLWAPPAIYQDSSKRWLSGVPDDDIPADPRNWIRSGTYYTTNSVLSKYNDYDMNKRPWDPNKSLGKIQSLSVPYTINGVTSTTPPGATWAPYVLAAGAEQSPNRVGPAYSLEQKRNFSSLSDIPSVDIVFTADKSKWTRCCVIEICPDPALAQGNAPAFTLRRSASLNIDGKAGVVSSNPQQNSDYIASTGMSWFPGYAINIETGERLNIIFGENSWLGADNGSDMLFNPTSRIFNPSGTPVFGGQHYVYIMGHMKVSVDPLEVVFPAYDAGEFINAQFHQSLDIYKKIIFGTALYTSIPLSVDGVPWLDNQVTIKIRVNRAYQRFYSMPLPGESNDTLNRNYPVYLFNTSTIATGKDNTEKASSDLDLINVVPNPYYAYDDYERNQLDNRIKIVNLPTKCTVSIFDLSGTLIRQFNVDKSSIAEPRSSTLGINTDSKTSIDWDLKNFAGIPISGGVYLIHVKSPDLGERTIRWFGMLRPVDLNSL